MKRGGTKTMSPAQVAANRRNAQKSTGPKSVNGKAVAKMNALKHGVLAQTVVVRGQQFKESAGDFKKLCREFYADLQPAGPLEEMLVDQIVQASWRLRRARSAESGEIALSVDEGHWQRQRMHPRQQWTLWEIWGEPMWEMGNSAMGNSILAGWLRDVRASVEREGELTEAAVKIPFHGKPNQLSEELAKLRQEYSASSAGEGPGDPLETRRAQLLAHIDKKLRMLEWRREGCEQREQSTEQARQTAAVLPGNATLDKILRYETALERQIYRAMNQLERLQRRRQGEAVPPPMAFEVSDRH